MKRVTLLFFILLIQISSVFAAENPYAEAFLPGERLEFNIYFEFVLGGHASMEVEGIEEVNGFSCYHIVSQARSTKTVDFFYKVRDKVESWRDIDGHFSRKFSKKPREGKHKYDRSVEYFPEDSVAYARDRKRDFATDTLIVLKHVQDVLSSFYETRTRELFVGDTLEMPLEDDGKQYEVLVLVKRKETVEVNAGKLDCIVVEPTLKTSGLFRAEGQMEIWLTDDQYHMPVLMKSKLYFGRVWAKLEKYTRGSKN